MQNVILYQAYGGLPFINECRYSLLRYLHVYNLTPPTDTAIVIYTDAPEQFADFQPFISTLSTQQLTEYTIQKWRGAQNFVHRVKIEMLIDFLKHYNGNVLYCDTDTYLTSPVHSIFSNIAAGNFYMHADEGRIDKKHNPTFHKWERFLSTTPISFNQKTLLFHRTLHMFNAGVVGLNSQNREVLHDVLALTDTVYQKFPKHIAEQFAFSYCLQKSGSIKTADSLIAHYWNLKEFRYLLETFFAVNAEESIPNLVKKLHYLNAVKIQSEKDAFEALPLLQRLLQNIRGKGWKIASYTKPFTS